MRMSGPGSWIPNQSACRQDGEDRLDSSCLPKAFLTSSSIADSSRPEFHDEGQPQSRRLGDQKDHLEHFGPRRPTA